VCRKVFVLPVDCEGNAAREQRCARTPDEAEAGRQQGARGGGSAQKGLGAADLGPGVDDLPDLIVEVRRGLERSAELDGLLRALQRILVVVLDLDVDAVHRLLGVVLLLPRVEALEHRVEHPLLKRQQHLELRLRPRPEFAAAQGGVVAVARGGGGGERGDPALRRLLDVDVALEHGQHVVRPVHGLVLRAQVRHDLRVRRAKIVDVGLVDRHAGELDLGAGAVRGHVEARFLELQVRLHAAVHVGRADGGDAERRAVRSDRRLRLRSSGALRLLSLRGRSAIRHVRWLLLYVSCLGASPVPVPLPDSAG